MTEDLHSPTNAGPDASQWGQPTADAPEDTPAFAGTAPAPDSEGSPSSERPEVLVGAAFAGGVVAAMILKRLGR
jgi:hypothetical protein